MKEEKAVAKPARHHLKRNSRPSMVPSTMLNIFLMKGVSHKTN